MNGYRMNFRGMARAGDKPRRYTQTAVALALMTIAGAAIAQPVVFVDQNAAGAGDGSNWADAYLDLQSALDAAEQAAGEIREVWVAAGTYKPSKRTNPDDPRSATFSLLDGVSLYGGFAGTETSIDDRDLDAHAAILSGDFNGDDEPGFRNYDENALHVVTARDLPGALVFDGFTVTGGYAFSPSYGSERGAGMVIDEAWPSVANCTFTRNFAGRDRTNVAHGDGGGAGAYVFFDPDKSCRPVAFRDCRFLGNETLGIGGGLFLLYGRVEMDGCSFDRNVAYDGGGIGAENDAGMTLRSSWFTDNTASEYGGAVGFIIGGYSDLSIDGCQFSGNAAYSGGAVYYQGGNMRVSASEFHENIATWTGGALYSAAYLANEILDSSFDRNHAERGGAIESPYDIAIHRTRFFRNSADVDGGAVILVSEFQATDCTFIGNWAVRFGGGVAAWYGPVDLARCRFESNSASQGGGIYAQSGDLPDRSMRAVECEFEANVAVIGGAVSSGSDLLMDRCSLTRNRAEVGGGLFTTGNSSNGSLASCLVAYNEAYAYGGGIAGGAGMLRVENCTIANNTAWALGAGMVVGDDTTVSNSIVWGNVVDPSGGAWTDESAQIDGLERADVAYSDVQGWSGIYRGAGNFALDPLFVEPLDPDGPYGPAEADFHLQPDSPCINAGFAKVLDWGPWFPPPPNLDLDGKPRVLCDLIDLGAYETGLAGDVDCDLRVDLEDFSHWSQCAFGPWVLSPCPVFDADGDGDVDLADLAELFQVLSPGP